MFPPEVEKKLLALAAQEMALRKFQPERKLPAGAKNIFDVMPVIRGSETDEEVKEALKELS